LSDLAQQRAEINASTGVLAHTPNLALGVTSNWTKLGENIGVGQDHDGIWNAFLNSPPHLANLLDPTYTSVGIGDVSTGPGNDWVVHRFMRVAAPAAPPPPTLYVPAPVNSYVSPPPIQSTTPRSTSRPAAGGSAPNSGSNSTSGSNDTTAGATSTLSPASTTGTTGDGDADAEDGVPRSPDRVAAVVNVLQALEQ
jgi:hypothetical protein